MAKYIYQRKIGQISLGMIIESAFYWHMFVTCKGDFWQNDSLGFDYQAEATFENITLDILKSSEIEGEN